MRPPLDATGILKGVVGQAAGKLPYATTLWLLDAVARHATAASSDLFCVPFRGARQRARLPTVQTTPPADPGALYGAFAPQAVLRALPLPAARAASVRLPPAARSPAACAAAGCRPGVEAALPSRASVRREEARRGAGMGAGRAPRALRVWGRRTAEE